jgi:hypothetical protein
VGSGDAARSKEGMIHYTAFEAWEHRDGTHQWMPEVSGHVVEVLWRSTLHAGQG